jgi:hypothetical protein
VDAQDEFGKVKRLGEVVVGAELQAGDTLAGRTRGGQHEDHRGVVGVGDEPADRVAV